MSPLEQPFVEQLRQEPGNDEARLVYADWLEEHGELERARFLRLELELDGHRFAYLDPDQPVSLTAEHANLAHCPALHELYATMDAISDEPAMQNLWWVPESRLQANWATSNWIESVRLRYELHTAKKSNLAPHPVGKIELIRQLLWIRRDTLLTLKRAIEGPPHRFAEDVDLESVLVLREVSSQQPRGVRPPYSAAYCQLQVRRRTQPVVEQEKPARLPRSISFHRRHQTCQRWFELGWTGDSKAFESFMSNYCDSAAHMPQWKRRDARVSAKVSRGSNLATSSVDQPCQWLGIVNAAAVVDLQLAHQPHRYRGKRRFELYLRPVYLGAQQISPNLGACFQWL